MFDYRFAFLYGKVRTLKGKNLLAGGASSCLYRGRLSKINSDRVSCFKGI